MSPHREDTVSRRCRHKETETETVTRDGEETGTENFKKTFTETTEIRNGGFPLRCKEALERRGAQRGKRWRPSPREQSLSRSKRPHGFLYHPGCSVDKQGSASRRLQTLRRLPRVAYFGPGIGRSVATS